MKKIFCLFISAVLLLSGCKNSDTSNATSSERKSEGQSPVLLKITDYDENAKLVSWTEYDYSATHQVKWQKYDANNQSEGYGIKKYTDDGVLISDCSYNADGEPVNEYAYAETGTLLKDGNYYYAEDGTLSEKYILTYNDDGTVDTWELLAIFQGETIHNKTKWYYSESGIPLKETWYDYANDSTYDSASFICNESGKVTKEVEYLSTGEISLTKTYKYDEYGNEIEQTWSNGSWWKDAYDKNGNKTESRNSFGELYVYAYDDNGNELKVRYTKEGSPESNYSRDSTYDEHGRCIEVKTTYPYASENDIDTITEYGDYGEILKKNSSYGDGHMLYSVYEYKN